MDGFFGNIERMTLANEHFRQVVFTGQHLQLVLMTLQPNEDIGSETHAVVDQFIRVEDGDGKLVLNGEEHALHDGDAFVIPAGARHNVLNTSSEHELKLYTLYAPPHHKQGTIHATKAEAQHDSEDHL